MVQMPTEVLLIETPVHVSAVPNTLIHVKYEYQ